MAPWLVRYLVTNHMVPGSIPGSSFGHFCDLLEVNLRLISGPQGKVKGIHLLYNTEKTEDKHLLHGYGPQNSWTIYLAQYNT